MHASQAPSFSKGGPPLFTIKYPHIQRVAPLALTVVKIP